MNIHIHIKHKHYSGYICRCSVHERGEYKKIMIPVQDIETLDFSEADGATLDNLLSDAHIIGAEPIGYPLTDGTIIYVRDRQGKKRAMITEYDAIEKQFTIRVAELK